LLLGQNSFLFQPHPTAGLNLASHSKPPSTQPNPLKKFTQPNPLKKFTQPSRYNPNPPTLTEIC
jgi:hypothetical protein